MAYLFDMWNSAFSLFPESEYVFHQVMNWYELPGRKYHTSAHLQQCFKQYFTWFSPKDYRNLELELAIWFHDVQYDVSRHDNEMRSAAIATTMLGKRHWHVDLNYIHGLIMSTTHDYEVTLHGDHATIADVDLSILATPFPHFRVYESQIRKEYEGYPLADYVLGRFDFVANMLKRPHIFHSHTGRYQYEIIARRNLRILASRLREAYGQLAGASPELPPLADEES